MKNLQESHYSRKTETVRRYLNPDLNMAKLHRLFCKKFPEHSIGYDKFRKVVKENCDVHFGEVRSDICESCEKTNVNLAAAKRRSDDVAIGRLEQDKEIHLKQAQSFYDGITAQKASPNNDTWAICMDFEKNLPLPVTTSGLNITNASFGSTISESSISRLETLQCLFIVNILHRRGRMR